MRGGGFVDELVDKASPQGEGEGAYPEEPLSSKPPHPPLRLLWSSGPKPSPRVRGEEVRAAKLIPP